MFFRSFLFLLWLAMLFPGWGYPGEGRWEEPWQALPSSPGKKDPGRNSPLSPGQKVASGILQGFKEYISPVDGDRCPCYPTCSQYSQEAIRKHGLLIGLVMTFDRLIHEADEIRKAPLVKVYDSYRYYDPVENNDFWWYKNRNQRSAFSDR